MSGIEEIDTLFDRLAADPTSLAAFESYAKAVEAAASQAEPDTHRRLAEDLVRHLSRLPALAESKVGPAMRTVARRLTDSVEFREIRPGRALTLAIEGAERALQARYPRVQGVPPEEFVSAHRHDPGPILDYLDSADQDWLTPRLQRCRSLIRNAREVPGDPALDSLVAGALAEIGEAIQPILAVSYAEVAFRASLLFDPGQDKARTGLGILARRFGRLHQAELEFRAALDRNPEAAEALAGLGEVLLETGRPAEAEALASRLLDLHPERPEGHLLRAEVRLCEDQPGEALSSLLDAMDLDPDGSEAYRLLAVAYAALGRADLSARHHEAWVLRLGRGAARPDPAAPRSETPWIDPSLLREPPPPPARSGADDPEGVGVDHGPLTRSEAFRRLLEHCLEDGEIPTRWMGTLLRARARLRIGRDDFDRLLSEAQARVEAQGTTGFEGRDFFEELRRQAWRDGYLSPEERTILEDVLAALDLDRRHRPRTTPN